MPGASVVQVNGKKEKACATQKAKIDYQRFITKLSANRQPSELRELAALLSKMPPDTIFLGVGSPNINLLPFESVNIQLKNGNELKISDQTLKTVLQYLPTTGYVPFCNKIRELQDFIHGPQDWSMKDILITNGAQDGANQAISMMLKSGDPILIQNPVFPGFADILRPMEVEFLPINQDQHGIKPDHLIEVLEKRSKMKDKEMPKVLYVNPTSSNPTASLLSTERKKEIYRIAQRFDLIILEDDPYYFVNFLDEDPVSLLSMDTDGRVIRFDSFSKILSSGLRLGYVTGPKELLERMNLHMQVLTVHSSGISQAIVYALLSHWGVEGLRKHLVELCGFYKERRDYMLKCADKYLKDVATWNVPEGGMFLWLTIKPVNDLQDLITKQCVQKKLLVAPGYAFKVDKNDTTQNIRLCYSVASPEQVDKGVKILGQLIRDNLKR